MRGVVDNGGRALVKVDVKKANESEATTIEVWIDTGFTGEFVMSVALIQRLGLEPSGSVDAILADGSQIALSTYTCLIEWFGETKTLEIIANNGEYPLLGVGLLLGLELRVDYLNRRLELTPAKQEDF